MRARRFAANTARIGGGFAHAVRVGLLAIHLCARHDSHMNQADTPLLRMVRAELNARKGQWREVVALTGVSQPTLSRIASGEVADPSVRAVERLGMLFGIRVTRDQAAPKGRRTRAAAV